MGESEKKGLPDSRKEQGKNLSRWKPGQSGNPNGRPGKGAQIRQKLMELAPDAIRAISEGIKKGDATCLKIWADRCDPAPKSILPAVKFNCDTVDLTQAALSVISAISRGDVSPEVGTSIISAIGQAAKVAEVDELRRELADLQSAVRDMRNE
ncbi:hypothetical protein ERD95_20115 [Enterobacteriaceae bacterium ML5]|nr:hypothetical protein ERD95_20115 [Enterobacteriaceae bacterium ML5]